MWNPMWWMVLWMGLGALLLLGGIGAIVYFAAWLFRGGRQQGSRALDILAERFARGEIDAEQYQNMRRELER